jgi:phospholipase/carboxylesterase
MAAFVGYSGRLIGAADIAREAASKPPVLLVHGAADDVVPAASTETAARDLRAAGFEVEAHIRPGLGHGIDPEGLALGGDFLAARLAR